MTIPGINGVSRLLSEDDQLAFLGAYGLEYGSVPEGETARAIVADALRWSLWGKLWASISQRSVRA